jgi:AcrR family transcriptional regulator
VSVQPKKNGTKKGKRSREAIIDAAIPLFAQQGFRGASLASIAAAAGLTQPGLLHHFRSKEELLLGVLDRRDHDDGKRLSSLRPGPGFDYTDPL